MTYGFIDESGAPGVAVNNNDFLVVSAVLFDEQAAMSKCNEAMKRLRAQLGLKKDYEFHCSKNTTFAQNGMFRLIERQKFRFITVSLKKTRKKKDASYAEVARLLVQELRKICDETVIVMDKNPTLCASMRKELRAAELKFSLREVESKKNDLIQLTDYVVNLSARKVKESSKISEQYRCLLRKQLVFLDIRK